MFPLGMIYRERLRFGAVELLKHIRKQGIALWIYTTSYRSERDIRRFFCCCGTRLDCVINGEQHAKEVQGNRTEGMPSKYPSKYRIDLHIDDDISVVQNGKVYGFRVLIVKRHDEQWTDRI